jgi:hypothetical protein
LEKLVPIKIEECKLPINYRGIHTPEVFKSKAELNELAQMLSDKYSTARPLPRVATEPTTTKIEFTDKSSADFLTRLSTQTAAYEKEAQRGLLDDVGLEKRARTSSFDKKISSWCSGSNASAGIDRRSMYRSSLISDPPVFDLDQCSFLFMSVFNHGGWPLTGRS